MKSCRITSILCALMLCGACEQAPVADIHYGAEPLKFKSVKEWEKQHRPAIMAFFENEVYGKMPEKNIPIKAEVLEEGSAFGGKAIRRQVALKVEGSDIPMIVLMYIPSNAKGPSPAFLCMNFKGNHNVNPDPEIIISPNAPDTKNGPEGITRGVASSRWPIEMIIDSGYAVVTVNRDNVDPDSDDGFKNSYHSLFYKEGQSYPEPDEWGTIGMWAWSLSRVMDYMEDDKSIDHKHVAVVGHSRLGKTSLWAGVTDPRFAIVISNNSGCGGAALSIRKHGETVAKINKSFPHWFCDNYNKYNDNEEALKIDQQGLIALIAPRPVYVASASLDDWADPEGEFLSAVNASPVYELYGLKGLTGATMPGINSPLQDGHVAYHLREGKHDITSYDWEQYIKFANRHFGK